MTSFEFVCPSMIVLLHIIWPICICHWYTHVTGCHTTVTDCRHLNNDTIRALHLAVFRCAGLALLVESKWCDYVMAEADSHLKLLPTSILDIYKVIEHINMLSMGIQYQPYIVIPTLLGSDFGVLGHLWSQNDVIMSWLRPTATSNCFLYPY